MVNYWDGMKSKVITVLNEAADIDTDDSLISEMRVEDYVPPTDKKKLFMKIITEHGIATVEREVPSI